MPCKNKQIGLDERMDLLCRARTYLQKVEVVDDRRMLSSKHIAVLCPATDREV